jgi:hypothetical protein
MLALSLSGFDPNADIRPLGLVSKITYALVGASGAGTINEAAQIHHACRRCGGVAGGGASAAT